MKVEGSDHSDDDNDNNSTHEDDYHNDDDHSGFLYHDPRPQHTVTTNSTTNSNISARVETSLIYMLDLRPGILVPHHVRG